MFNRQGSTEMCMSVRLVVEQHHTDSALNIACAWLSHHKEAGRTADTDADVVAACYRLQHTT